MIRLGIASGALCLIAACGGAEKGAAEPTAQAGEEMQPCAAAQPCGGGQACAAPMPGGEAPSSGHDWSSWQSWDKLTAEPFESEHGKAPFVDIYVSPDHVDAFTSLEGTMPEGMAIVKAAHANVDGAAGELKALTVMAKMEPGYDPENGDWYYGVLDPTGTKAKMQGPLAKCSGCHEGAGTDYVFGETGN